MSPRRRSGSGRPRRPRWLARWSTGLIARYTAKVVRLPDSDCACAISRRRHGHWFGGGRVVVAHRFASGHLDSVRVRAAAPARRIAPVKPSHTAAGSPARRSDRRLVHHVDDARHFVKQQRPFALPPRRLPLGRVPKAVHRRRTATGAQCAVPGLDDKSRNAAQRWPAEGSDGTDGRWRIGRRVAPGRVVSTVEPEARHTRSKSPENRRDGYRAQVSADPETGIITDEKLTQAAGVENSDAAVAEDFLAVEPESREWYGDSAYGTGDLRAAIDDSEGDVAVIKPEAGAGTGRGRVHRR